MENEEYLPIEPDEYLGMMPNTCLSKNYGKIFSLDKYIIVTQKEPAPFDQFIAGAVSEGKHAHNSIMYYYSMQVFDYIGKPKIIYGTPRFVMTLEKSFFDIKFICAFTDHLHINFGKCDNNISWDELNIRFIKELKDLLNIKSAAHKIDMDIQFYIDNMKELVRKYRAADDYNGAFLMKYLNDEM